MSSQPASSSVATSTGTRWGMRWARRCRIAASAMKWSQHALNHSVPRSVGTSKTAEMLHTRCVRSPPVRVRPEAAS